MRLHIEMDDGLVQQIDDVAGRRRRSKFVRDAVVAALDRSRRAELIMSARGSISDTGHEWDDDPAGWVREQRHVDPRRVG